MNNLAFVNNKLRNYDEAKILFLKCFEIQKNIYLTNESFKLYDWSDTGVFEESMIRTGKEHFHDITGHLPATPAPMPISFLDEYNFRYVKVEQDC
jgi:hypothetical protein